MPTYDYICDGCGHEFEAFESIKADPQKHCPKCNTEQLRRKIGAGAAILFKGSGFYITDYRSDSYNTGHIAENSCRLYPSQLNAPPRRTANLSSSRRPGTVLRVSRITACVPLTAPTN